LPQILHLAREHCSAGVSSRAWAMWLTSSLLIGALALHRHDRVFVALQVSSLISAAAIVLLAHRYRGMFCETHACSRPDDRTTSQKSTEAQSGSTSDWTSSAQRRVTRSGAGSDPA
jgi:hypothetical protein